MGRKIRNYFEGAVYHVIQRGNNKAFIFQKQADKIKLLDLLCETMQTENYHYKLLYYVIMDNHYHLIVETPSIDANVSRIFQRVNMLFAKYYNKVYERCGGIYGGRPSIILIENTGQLMQTLRYIAYNPVRAGIADKPDSYKWSAHSLILNHRKGMVDTELLFSKLYDDPKTSFENYKYLIESGRSEDGKLSLQKSEPDKPKSGSDLRMHSLNKLLFQHENGIEENIYRICTGDREPKIIGKRKEFIDLAYCKGYNKNEISKLLNMTRPGVSKALTRSEAVEGKLKPGV